MINIRIATDEDLPKILEIVNHNIQHSTAVYDYEPKTEAFIKHWFQEKQENNYPVLVAEYKGEVSGYASYAQLKAKDGYKFTMEHSVYVAPGQEGKGIGKLLLAQLIAIAKKNNIHSLIGLIDADNAGSIAFHKKFGFTEAGFLKEAGYKFDRWLDVVIMQLYL
ncbi:GNAT family N-acetyltransferase [Flavobacterium rhizosphaerae]|uniref:N-acetyltransferase family protein n=1 Tax=Flavobacterium rhizosphaerae TaxID=3163298 RepID=A0ABW8YVI6_9FLAO